jgi:pyruvate dehydrogenase E1 component beta subunit
MPVMTIRDAMHMALREALDEDSRVFIIGEDIGPYGGTYAVTKGLYDDYGPQRIKDSPLAESVIIGAGVGSAMGGMRPIVEIMTINFTLLGMDQIVNHAAKLRYMSGGQIEIPLIVRTVTGGGAQLAATHSQNFEGWYASVPGLKVVAPSTPYDALGLFRACRQTMDPILFVEHALLYSVKGEVPKEHFTVPLGKAEVKRPGKDITIISHARMLHTSLSAAETLSKEGIEAEVLDLRTMRPLDVESIVNSVKKTHRAVVVEETWKTGGFAAEIVSLIQENAFDYLDAPVLRVAGEEVPAPYSAPLENLAFPDPAKVVGTVRAVFGA